MDALFIKVFFLQIHLLNITRKTPFKKEGPPILSTLPIPVLYSLGAAESKLSQHGGLMHPLPQKPDNQCRCRRVVGMEVSCLPGALDKCCGPSLPEGRPWSLCVLPIEVGKVRTRAPGASAGKAGWKLGERMHALPSLLPGFRLHAVHAPSQQAASPCPRVGVVL